MDVVDYELNAGLAELYQELQKLRHAEELMTELAMAYQPISPDDLREIELQLIRTRLENVPEQGRETYVRLIAEAFPHLTEAEIREAIR